MKNIHTKIMQNSYMKPEGESTELSQNINKKQKRSNLKRVNGPSSQVQQDLDAIETRTTKNKRMYITTQSQGDGNTTQPHTENKKRKLYHNSGIHRSYKQRRIIPQSRTIHSINKTGPRGMPIRRGWHYYIRHTHRSRHRVRKKHKLDSTKSPHPKRNRR